MSRFARARRWTPILVGIALFVVLTKLLFEDLLGLTWGGMLGYARTQGGPGAAAVIVGLLLVDLAIPVPSSFVMILSGALFGPLAGAALSLAGSLAGNCLGFELARRGGQRAARRMVGDERLEALRQQFAGRAAAIIIISRPLPVLMETLSVVAGLSDMSRRTFVLASLAGTLPVVLLYAWAGSVAAAEESITIAAFVLAAVVGLGWLLATASGLRRHLLPQRRAVDAEHLGGS